MPKITINNPKPQCPTSSSLRVGDMFQYTRPSNPDNVYMVVTNDDSTYHRRLVNLRTGIVCSEGQDTAISSVRSITLEQV